jgi:hypothetical protein
VMRAGSSLRGSGAPTNLLGCSVVAIAPPHTFAPAAARTAFTMLW